MGYNITSRITTTILIMIIKEKNERETGLLPSFRFPILSGDFKMFPRSGLDWMLPLFFFS